MKTNSFIFNSEISQNELDSKDTLVFAFYNRQNNKEAESIQSKFPNSTVIGCSSSGSILLDKIYETETVVSVLKLEKSKFIKKTYTCEEFDNCIKVGEQIGKDLFQKDIKGIIILSEGLLVNGSKLTDGINSIIKEKIYIGGGMAGDGMNFNSTSTLDGSESEKKKIIAIGLYGEELSFASDYEGGWKNFGPTRTVTKSKNNILFELDGKPALTLYKEFLGSELASQLPGSALYYPLSITNDEGEETVRSILSVDENNKSLTFAGDLPEGSSVRLMHCTNEGLAQAATNTSERIFNKLDSATNPFILVVSCVGRKVVLGEYTEDELMGVNERFSGSSIAGFYSYGEFSRGKEKSSQLHNQTLTIIGIQEK